VLTRQQYGKPPVWERQATLWAQLGMWFQYFSWQWGRDFPRNIQYGLAVLFGAVGLLGAVRHWLADRRRAIAMTVLMATFTLLLIFYLNFKYGYSWDADKQLAREVRERDYFFIASFALWGVWGRDGARDPHGVDQRGPRAPRARRPPPLAARDAGARTRAHPAVGESSHRLAQG